MEYHRTHSYEQPATREPRAYLPDQRVRIPSRRFTLGLFSQPTPCPHDCAHMRHGTLFAEEFTVW